MGAGETKDALPQLQETARYLKELSESLDETLDEQNTNKRIEQSEALTQKFFEGKHLHKKAEEEVQTKAEYSPIYALWEEFLSLHKKFNSIENFSTLHIFALRDVPMRLQLARAEIRMKETKEILEEKTDPNEKLFYLLQQLQVEYSSEEQNPFFQALLQEELYIIQQKQPGETTLFKKYIFFFQTLPLLTEADTKFAKDFNIVRNYYKALNEAENLSLLDVGIEEGEEGTVASYRERIEKTRQTLKTQVQNIPKPRKILIDIILGRKSSSMQSILNRLQTNTEEGILLSDIFEQIFKGELEEGEGQKVLEEWKEVLGIGERGLWERLTDWDWEDKEDITEDSILNPKSKIQIAEKLRDNHKYHEARALLLSLFQSEYSTVRKKIFSKLRSHTLSEDEHLQDLFDTGVLGTIKTLEGGEEVLSTLYEASRTRIIGQVSKSAVQADLIKQAERLGKTITSEELEEGYQETIDQLIEQEYMQREQFAIGTYIHNSGMVDHWTEDQQAAFDIWRDSIGIGWHDFSDETIDQIIHEATINALFIVLGGFAGSMARLGVTKGLTGTIGLAGKGVGSITKGRWGAGLGTRLSSAMEMRMILTGALSRGVPMWMTASTIKSLGFLAEVAAFEYVLHVCHTGEWRPYFADAFGDDPIKQQAAIEQFLTGVAMLSGFKVVGHAFRRPLRDKATGALLRDDFGRVMTAMTNTTAMRKAVILAETLSAEAAVLFLIGGGAQAYNAYARSGQWNEAEEVAVQYAMADFLENAAYAVRTAVALKAGIHSVTHGSHHSIAYIRQTEYVKTKMPLLALRTPQKGSVKEFSYEKDAPTAFTELSKFATFHFHSSVPRERIKGFFTWLSNSDHSDFFKDIRTSLEMKKGESQEKIKCIFGIGPAHKNVRVEGKGTIWLDLALPSFSKKVFPEKKREIWREKIRKMGQDLGVKGVFIWNNRDYNYKKLYEQIQDVRQVIEANKENLRDIRVVLEPKEKYSGLVWRDNTNEFVIAVKVGERRTKESMEADIQKGLQEWKQEKQKQEQGEQLNDSQPPIQPKPSPPATEKALLKNSEIPPEIKEQYKLTETSQGDTLVFAGEIPKGNENAPTISISIHATQKPTVHMEMKTENGSKKMQKSFQDMTELILTLNNTLFLRDHFDLFIRSQQEENASTQNTIPAKIVEQYNMFEAEKAENNTLFSGVVPKEKADDVYLALFLVVSKDKNTYSLAIGDKTNNMKIPYADKQQFVNGLESPSKLREQFVEKTKNTSAEPFSLMEDTNRNREKKDSLQEIDFHERSTVITVEGVTFKVGKQEGQLYLQTPTEFVLLSNQGMYFVGAKTEGKKDIQVVEEKMDLGEAYISLAVKGEKIKVANLRERKEMDIKEAIHPLQINKKSQERVQYTGETICIGDLNGSLKTFFWNLSHARVIDVNGNWIAGNKKVVFQGDFLGDRGGEGLKILVSIAKLRKQAEKEGGEIIVLAGNHEDLVFSLLTRDGKHYAKDTSGEHGERDIFHMGGYGLVEFLQFTNQSDKTPPSFPEFKNMPKKRDYMKGILKKKEILENMRGSQRGRILLEEMCKMQLCTRIGNKLVIHTDPTDAIFRLIVHEGVDSINQRFQAALKGALFHDKAISAEDKKLFDIFLSTNNRTIGDREGKTVTRDEQIFSPELLEALEGMGIKHIAYGHSNVGKDLRIIKVQTPSGETITLVSTDQGSLKWSDSERDHRQTVNAATFSGNGEIKTGEEMYRPKIDRETAENIRDSLLEVHGIPIENIFYGETTGRIMMKVDVPHVGEIKIFFQRQQANKDRIEVYSQSGESGRGVISTIDNSLLDTVSKVFAKTLNAMLIQKGKKIQFQTEGDVFSVQQQTAMVAFLPQKAWEHLQRKDYIIRFSKTTEREARGKVVPEMDAKGNERKVMLITLPEKTGMIGKHPQELRSLNRIMNTAKDEYASLEVKTSTAKTDITSLWNAEGTTVSLKLPEVYTEGVLNALYVLADIRPEYLKGKAIVITNKKASGTNVKEVEENTITLYTQNNNGKITGYPTFYKAFRSSETRLKTQEFSEGPQLEQRKRLGIFPGNKDAIFAYPLTKTDAKNIGDGKKVGDILLGKIFSRDGRLMIEYGILQHFAIPIQQEKTLRLPTVQEANKLLEDTRRPIRYIQNANEKDISSSHNTVIDMIKERERIFQEAQRQTNDTPARLEYIMPEIKIDPSTSGKIYIENGIPVIPIKGLQSYQILEYTYILGILVDNPNISLTGKMERNTFFSIFLSETNETERVHAAKNFSFPIINFSKIQFIADQLQKEGKEMTLTTVQKRYKENEYAQGYSVLERNSEIVKLVITSEHKENEAERKKILQKLYPSASENSPQKILIDSAKNIHSFTYENGQITNLEFKNLRFSDSIEANIRIQLYQFLKEKNMFQKGEVHTIYLEDSSSSVQKKQNEVGYLIILNKKENLEQHKQYITRRFFPEIPEDQFQSIKYALENPTQENGIINIELKNGTMVISSKYGIKIVFSEKPGSDGEKILTLHSIDNTGKAIQTEYFLKKNSNNKDISEKIEAYITKEEGNVQQTLSNSIQTVQEQMKKAENTLVIPEPPSVEIIPVLNALQDMHGASFRNITVEIKTEQSPDTAVKYKTLEGGQEVFTVYTKKKGGEKVEIKDILTGLELLVPDLIFVPPEVAKIRTDLELRPEAENAVIAYTFTGNEMVRNPQNGDNTVKIDSNLKGKTAVTTAISYENGRHIFRYNEDTFIIPEEGKFKLPKANDVNTDHRLKIKYALDSNPLYISQSFYNVLPAIREYGESNLPGNMLLNPNEKNNVRITEDILFLPIQGKETKEIVFLFNELIPSWKEGRETMKKVHIVGNNTPDTIKNILLALKGESPFFQRIKDDIYINITRIKNEDIPAHIQQIKKEETQ